MSLRKTSLSCLGLGLEVSHRYSRYDNGYIECILAPSLQPRGRYKRYIERRCVGTLLFSSQVLLGEDLNDALHGPEVGRLRNLPA